MIVVMGCLGMSGCAQIPFGKAHTPKSVTVAKKGGETPLRAINAGVAYSGLSLCQSELKSLQGVDNKLYQHHRTQLDNSLAKASQYVVMRPGLSGDMQSVMDSVYQAQLSRTCQQIHADLFSSLLKQADQ